MKTWGSAIALAGSSHGLSVPIGTDRLAAFGKPGGGLSVRIVPYALEELTPRRARLRDFDALRAEAPKLREKAEKSDSPAAGTPAARQDMPHRHRALPERDKGGRPEEYDWAAFEAEMQQRLASAQGSPPKRRALMRPMLDWCATQWGDRHPADSTVRDHLRKLFRRLGLE